MLKKYTFHMNILDSFDFADPYGKWLLPSMARCGKGIKVSVGGQKIMLNQ
ncbi:hypothetical protein [Desulforamulus putei]|nr:hypothetical protein [Desulforamulus putei]